MHVVVSSPLDDLQPQRQGLGHRVRAEFLAKEQTTSLELALRQVDTADSGVRVHQMTMHVLAKWLQIERELPVLGDGFDFTAGAVVLDEIIQGGEVEIFDPVAVRQYPVVVAGFEKRPMMQDDRTHQAAGVRLAQARGALSQDRSHQILEYGHVDREVRLGIEGDAPDPPADDQISHGPRAHLCFEAPQ